MSSVAKNFRKERAIYTFIICTPTRFFSSISEHFRGCVQVAHCHNKEENILLKRGKEKCKKKKQSENENEKEKIQTHSQMMRPETWR